MSADRGSQGHTGANPWQCTHCAKPVELVPPGAWWRHLSLDDQDACGIRLSDDAYNVDEDRYYISDDDDE